MLFVWIAVATLASEDLTCIATGGLIAAGKVGWFGGVLACLCGIFFGDLLLYGAGRLAGASLDRWVKRERLRKASEWLAARGPVVVLISRFTPGLRLPTYLAAGFLKTRFWTFTGYFLLAAALWTPLLVGGAALAGESVARGRFVAVLGLAAVLLAARRPRLQWEFLPPWITYLPLLPWLLLLAVKHRSLTVFRWANPGIPTGGLVGESKSRILAHLAEGEDCVPAFAVIRASLAPEERMARAAEFGATFPVVLKPDVGQRGRGVRIARSRAEVEAYLCEAKGDTIIQRYAGGLEFGIFYYRYPHEREGRIYSITEKRFPEVLGDGHSTIEELIGRDGRASRLARTYLSGMRRTAGEVPAEGERVPLVEVGSHCRGTVFLNGAHLSTEELRRAIDRIAKRHPGFYFGRFDLRATSIADLQAGRFQVLELNGVGAEATHIYDPSVSLVEAYRVMFRQWRMAFEIGAANRPRRAILPMPRRFGTPDTA